MNHLHFRIRPDGFPETEPMFVDDDGKFVPTEQAREEGFLVPPGLAPWVTRFLEGFWVQASPRRMQERQREAGLN
jgi:hypothetical protein